MSGCKDDEDICGLCGEPGADKMASWTGGGHYLPGETIPDTEMVHQSCEMEECIRAYNAMFPEARAAFLRGI